MTEPGSLRFTNIYENYDKNTLVDSDFINKIEKRYSQSKFPLK